MQNVARAYRKDLESILGRVIFHPVQFRKAVPLKKVQEEWVRVRKRQGMRPSLCHRASEFILQGLNTPICSAEPVGLLSIPL
jgi:hypothetical protein